MRRTDWRMCNFRIGRTRRMRASKRRPHRLAHLHDPGDLVKVLVIKKDEFPSSKLTSTMPDDSGTDDDGIDGDNESED